MSVTHPWDAAGIPMLLWCPMCHARHIDAGEYATKPHHTHSCQSCGLVWRPALKNTVGVAFLPGFKDDDGPMYRYVEQNAVAEKPSKIKCSEQPCDARTTTAACEGWFAWHVLGRLTGPVPPVRWACPKHAVERIIKLDRAGQK